MERLFWIILTGSSVITRILIRQRIKTVSLSEGDVMTIARRKKAT